MAQILHAVLNQHRPDSGIPRESASRAFGIIGELRGVSKNPIEAEIALLHPVNCDPKRVA
jgi:hypothetical protein